MVQIFKNTQALSQAAAELFVRAARQAVAASGRFTVALTGGSSPVQMHQLLAQKPYRDQVPWEQTYVFWGDERWVPLTDDQSNARMAFETLLNHVPIPKNQIFPMWGKQAPEVFAQQYAETLRQHLGADNPRFDLILLGLGDDGHAASLFPGTAVLHEKEKWVQAYYLEPKNIYRITLTAPVINQAQQIAFLTFGEQKADALYEVLAGEKDPEKYPAQLIQPLNGALSWLVDEAAARRLPASLVGG